jgi:hypothetical protein
MVAQLWNLVRRPTHAWLICAGAVVSVTVWGSWIGGSGARGPRPALRRCCTSRGGITGRRGSEAVKMDNVDLELVCEPNNAHDPWAVKVLAQGLHVGYLSRGNARRYCKRIEREGGQVRIKGFIGGVEGGPIGVRVHIPDDHPIARPLS